MLGLEKLWLHHPEAQTTDLYVKTPVANNNMLHTCFFKIHAG